jgi:hypothetical protein
MIMKTSEKERAMVLGDFIAGAYRAWGRRRAKGLVWLAIKAQLVMFRAPQPSLISED